ncbi:phosphoribosylglycinamide formyltransferase [Marinisporobacter balticus]|uniref:Phosphoribosylglycinamide formyltransferase n=1 Tax=Marinisporobacter balticus TaxID=2018667 RepID=A0A4R2L6G7_9FIRM|nr:phosphoribosylglycinamide formyltransferase [Marinisporobacter balticus]TCO74795.1 phosphoribosylglycinamide formyltransferase-1 [Marinisporobacter balticus]
MPKISIAVFVSGGGTNLQTIIDHIEKDNIDGEIKIILSSKENAYALERGKKHGIEGCYIGKKNYPDLKERSRKITEILKEKKIDLIVLAGFMSILDKEIVQMYKNRIINVHPSLIPSFCGKGYYGEKVHEAVLSYGVKVTGATVHFVDEGTDTGPVILQKAVQVKADDTVASLSKRVLAVEHEILPLAVELFCEGKLEVIGRRVTLENEI